MSDNNDLTLEGLGYIKGKNEVYTYLDKKEYYTGDKLTMTGRESSDGFKRDWDTHITIEFYERNECITLTIDKGQIDSDGYPTDDYVLITYKEILAIANKIKQIESLTFNKEEK